MESGCLGLIGLVVGFSVLMGGKTVAPGADTTLVGAIILGAGVLLSAVGAWEAIAKRRQERVERDKAFADLERLNQLRSQGILTDEEFSRQKQRVLREDEDEDVPPLDQIARLARLKEQGHLSEEEFATQKRELLRAQSLQRLVQLRDDELLNEEEYHSERRKILGES